MNKNIVENFEILTLNVSDKINKIKQIDLTDQFNKLEQQVSNLDDSFTDFTSNFEHRVHDILLVSYPSPNIAI